MQIKSEGKEIFYRPPPSFSPSLLLHSISPPPSFATPVMCELSLNGCGDDVASREALWVMSGFPCIAVNMESERCSTNPRSEWDKLLSFNISVGCIGIHYHMAPITSSRCCYLFTIVRVVGVCGGCDHAGMCSRRALDRRDLVLPPSG